MAAVAFSAEANDPLSGCRMLQSAKQDETLSEVLGGRGRAGLADQLVDDALRCRRHHDLLWPKAAPIRSGRRSPGLCGSTAIDAPAPHAQMPRAATCVHRRSPLR